MGGVQGGGGGGEDSGKKENSTQIRIGEYLRQ